ncbi:MAG: TPMT family class I SAM-dependent methyltransferase [Flavobacteriaceae bacterium]|nr:TPMT family class I SAM-dependent methyltransferase [Flavobacteriaceae bacterium]
MKTDKFSPKYWEEKYKNNNIGWNIGYPSTPIKEYIDQLKDKSVKVLIPGAGNGYEAEYLYNKGFTNVWVLDLAKNPLENLKQRLPNFPDKQLIQGDFFKHNAQYDLIIEQTFFCALDPVLRDKYVVKMATLLKPHGKLVGLLFDFELTVQGPPFGGCAEEYKKRFLKYFKIKVLERAHNSIKPRNKRELFVIFENQFKT